jgi:hypothetical protein
MVAERRFQPRAYLLIDLLWDEGPDSTGNCRPDAKDKNSIQVFDGMEKKGYVNGKPIQDAGKIGVVTKQVKKKTEIYTHSLMSGYILGGIITEI